MATSSPVVDPQADPAQDLDRWVARVALDDRFELKGRRPIRSRSGSALPSSRSFARHDDLRPSVQAGARHLDQGVGEEPRREPDVRTAPARSTSTA